VRGSIAILINQKYNHSRAEVNAAVHERLIRSGRRMPPSSTVENYLKEVYLGVGRLPAGATLLPMGQLAAALGVAPGTATTMVKALAESGLVYYEPYNGVRLTAAGTRLAATVLRRHRLVELFLVQVMGMRWDEVHDDAEHLEHVVSDRLIDRIDEMLGHPETDPHGDPIPGKEGTIRERHFETLLTCPVGTRVVVARVSDQDPVFLRFVERHGLKPGQVVSVEARDEVADAVHLRGADEATFTLGARAASKLLVDVSPETARAAALTTAAGPAATPRR